MKQLRSQLQEQIAAKSNDPNKLARLSIALDRLAKLDRHEREHNPDPSNPDEAKHDPHRAAKLRAGIVERFEKLATAKAKHGTD